MCKSEIFAKIINAVSIETEVSAKLLQESGFYPMQIARYMHKTSASIRFLLTNYESRKNTNKMIPIYTQNIRNAIEKY